jgi:alkylation response protein AidB-like acyl-CoA dehydrogenase
MTTATSGDGIEPRQAADRTASPEDWLQRVHALTPVVDQWRDTAEQERRMPQPLFEALRDAGLFSIGVPKAYGGLELDQETLAQVIEALSRLDGAVGWNVTVAANTALVAMQAPAAGKIYANPSAVVAGTFGAIPGNIALPETGGYRITGRWKIASGCHHADWAIGGCFVQDASGPRLLPNGMPDTRLFIVPTAKCEILDTWYTTGMRGTGSNDLQIKDVLVPEEWSLAVRRAEPRRIGVHAGKVFSTVGGPQLAAVALGIARGAIDAFTDLATAKIPTGGISVLASQQTVHERVGRAEALVRSARAYFYDTVREVTRHLAMSDEVSDELSASARLACAYVAETAAQVVDLMFVAGGMSATYASSRLDRHFRDVHMATQHFQVAASNIEIVGQYLLGQGLQVRR